MRYRRRPHQWDLFGNQTEVPRTEALPMANQTEAVLFLGRLLDGIVQTERQAAKTEGGDEQDQR